MGMNQTGEIARLSELTKPTVALVVNVQPVHLEKLGSLEAIRREKVSIALGLAQRRRAGAADRRRSAGVERQGRSFRRRVGSAGVESCGARRELGCHRAGERQTSCVQPDARCAAPSAECAGGAGIDSCRRPRCRGAGKGIEPRRHHDRPRRRADRRWRHRDRRQF